ncbi:GNAT family N-acetyltransferase [Flavobacterium sp. '19STA2R22 D10 B1']|uniref:GNAT family N-acetyltransferase n=1 Tax=Flavobacterium aerium TaxID=3037261 RepID=UPI00278C2427|nr:GNAT family N-acetyltransferase [Flavobacterium sp. '19STA2R22 D10 B1']
MSPIIKEISAAETFVVRHLVLRNNKPIESCRFDGDTLTTTKHYGIFIDNVLVGVASLFKNNTKYLDQNNQFQLRGMAILDSHQKKGLGEALLQHIEQETKNIPEALIWFNAREVAVGFYKKLGYEVIGSPFNIEDIGIHYVMYKKL